MAELTEYLLVDARGVVTSADAVRAVPPLDWVIQEDADPVDLADFASSDGLALLPPGSDGVALEEVLGLEFIDSNNGTKLDLSAVYLVPDGPDVPDLDMDPDVALEYAQANSSGEPLAPREALELE